jgi:formylglycine-generating enzyme required for sulfatase activity
VEVTGSSALVDQIVTMKGLGGGKTTWASKSLFFIADSEFTTITFRDVSATTDAIDLLLDNVKVMPTPTDLSLIPAGSFEMGDSLDGDADAMPVHTVNVSTFYMAKFEVTWALWDEVKTWAASHGYTDLPTGEGKASNHPVHTVNWYDVVKWCNARSERDGLIACYTVAGAVYRTGSNIPDCNWTANGYRLPTEAEWEKAARGGLTGQRFPWGATISHSQANYWSNGVFNYDVSPTLGHHPTYNDGVDPSTSTVGAFAANHYGIYDVAGNVWEWCWDGWSGSYYASSPVNDPRGPAASGSRVLRGGAWGYGADMCRVAARGSDIPSETDYTESSGFRPVRSFLR